MSTTTTYRKTHNTPIRNLRNAKTALMYLILVGLSVVFLIPFCWMLSTSLTDGGRVIMKDRSWIPSTQVVAQIGGNSYPMYAISASKQTSADHSFLVRLFHRSDGMQQSVAEISSTADGHKTVQRVVGGSTVKRAVDGKQVWQLVGGKLSGEPWVVGEKQVTSIERFNPVWSNYHDALTVLPFGTFLKNTLTITLLGIIGHTLSASLVAFGFSRMRFPGRDVLFIMVLSTMMLPAQVTMIPTFVLFVKLRWIDTLRPLIVPAYFGGGAFFIFLLRQFFLTLPSELEDAAKIDGCNALGIYRNVALPLSKPALATVAVFSFMAHWNDFMGPLIYTQSMEKKTLALGLYSFKGLHGTEYHLMMAAAIAVLLPVLIIFFSAQKYFVQGIVMSGIKG